MYLFLTRRFPNEDPRIASSRYSLRQQLLFMSATALVFVALFFVTRYLGWSDVFRYLNLILGMVYLFANRHLNKRFGQLGANEPPPKISKIRFNTLLIAIIIPFMVFISVSLLMNFPGYYLQLAFLIFMSALIGLIVWTRRSNFKNK